MKIASVSITAVAACALIACGGGGGDDGGDDVVVPGECGDGTLNTGEECDDGNTTAGDGCDGACQFEPPTATRLDTLEVRDPHMFAFDGAIDITSQVNDAIRDGLTMDMSDPPDGTLDLSFVLLFRPWDPDRDSGRVDAVAGAACTAPVTSTTCMFDPAAVVVESDAANGDSTCLEPGSGTTGDYDPPVTTPSGRCFATDKHVVNLMLGSVALMLQETQIAATYSESGHSLTNGLMIGFITEATADATILPEDLPVVGGMPLSSILLDSDMDDGPGGRGWWFYMNFTASEVTYTE